MYAPFKKVSGFRFSWFQVLATLGAAMNIINAARFDTTEYNIKQEFEILLNELRKYNPELLDKKRLLAVTKSDLLDEELKSAIQKELPKGIPSVFISSLANLGLMELKDLIWKNLKD